MRTHARRAAIAWMAADSQFVAPNFNPLVMVSGVCLCITTIFSLSLDLPSAGAQNDAIFNVAQAVKQRLTQDGVKRMVGLINLPPHPGVGAVGPVEHIPLTMLRGKLDSCAAAPMAVCQAFLPVLRVLGGGRVINVLPALPAMPSPFTALGMSAKHALTSFTTALRLELCHLEGPRVDVTLVEPVPSVFGVRITSEREANRAHRMFKMMGRRRMGGMSAHYKQLFKQWLRRAAPGIKTSRLPRPGQGIAGGAGGVAPPGGAFETPQKTGAAAGGEAAPWDTPAMETPAPTQAMGEVPPSTGRLSEAMQAESGKPQVLDAMGHSTVSAIIESLTARFVGGGNVGCCGLLWAAPCCSVLLRVALCCAALCYAVLLCVGVVFCISLSLAFFLFHTVSHLIVHHNPPPLYKARRNHTL